MDQGFAFADSGLNRAAELRGDVDALRAARQDPAARALVFWRSKPLMDRTSEGPQLVRVPMDHPLVLPDAPLIFMGLSGDEQAPVFVCDISAWQPQEQFDAYGTAFADPTEQQHPDAPESARFLEIRGLLAQLSMEDGELAASARAVLNWHASHGFCSRCGAASEMAQAGWQRICPSCNASHFPRTDPVVIMLVLSGNRTLLGRSPGWPEGMYSCLAGFIEPGETLEAAVRREVAEETGVPVGNVAYVASQPWPYPSSLMFGCVGAALDEEIRLDENELEDAFWISREDLADVFAGRDSPIFPARKGSIAYYLMHRWVSGFLHAPSE